VKRTTIAVCILCMSFASLAGAEADIGFRGIGGKIGFVTPSDIDGTIMFGAFADLGTFAPQVGFEANIDYWSSSESVGSINFDFSDLAIGARGKYLFEVQNEKWKPYAGGGLALHFVSSDIPAIGPFPGSSETNTKIGLDFLGGTNFTVGKQVDIVGEAMFRMVSNIGQFAVYFGAIYWLGGGGEGEAGEAGDAGGK